MLLSQRIVKDQKFLTTDSRTRMNPFDTRMHVVNAVKFIVPTTIYNDNETANTAMDRMFGEKATEKDRQRQIGNMMLFAKLPFPLMTVENETGLLIFEETTTGPLRWTMRSIDVHGKVNPIKTSAIGIIKSDGSVLCHMEADQKFIDLYKATKYDDKYSMYEVQQHLASITLMSAMHVLMFLNTSNVSVHTYTPSKKENSVVPKPLHGKFVYRVLDIYRERKLYVSLEDINNHVNSKEPLAERRAHLVRGHFKTIRNKLHWWNAFMRCRKNVNSVGLVQKDYNLITETGVSTDA